MERLGHSSITVTLNVYVHLFPNLDEALTDGLEATFQHAETAARAENNSRLSSPGTRTTHWLR